MTGPAGRGDHEFRLSPVAVRAGVWIDVGQWERQDKQTGKAYQDQQVSVSPPLIMCRDRSYSEAEAREKGWLL